MEELPRSMKVLLCPGGRRFEILSKILPTQHSLFRIGSKRIGIETQRSDDDHLGGGQGRGQGVAGTGESLFSERL